MDKKSSKDHASYINNVKDSLHAACKLKADIQNQVYHLIETLKKRELELLGRVDRHFLKQHETFMDNPKKYSLLTSRLEFHSEFNNCNHLLKNYGELKEFNCSNKACAVKNQPQKRNSTPVTDGFLADGMVPMKDVADSFEFVDSVECLVSEETKGKCCKVPLLDNFYGKEEYFSKEALEKLSCCSTDSFDVILNDDECEVNDLSRDRSANKAYCDKIYSDCPTFYLPNLQKKEQKDNGLLSLSDRQSPKRKSASEKPIEENSAVLSITSEANATGITSDKAENKSARQYDVNVLPLTSEAHITATSKNESAGHEGSDTPANALQASFRAYLQEENLEAWVHPKRESGGNDYEQWVVKSPDISKSSNNTAFIDVLAKQLKALAV